MEHRIRIIVLVFAIGAGIAAKTYLSECVPSPVTSSCPKPGHTASEPVDEAVGRVSLDAGGPLRPGVSVLG